MNRSSGLREPRSHWIIRIAIAIKAATKAPAPMNPVSPMTAGQEVSVRNKPPLGPGSRPYTIGNPKFMYSGLYSTAAVLEPYRPNPAPSGKWFDATWIDPRVKTVRASSLEMAKYEEVSASNCPDISSQPRIRTMGSNISALVTHAHLRKRKDRTSEATTSPTKSFRLNDKNVAAAERK